MKASADINAEDNYGGTVLHRAVKNGHEEVVILLIGAGANFSKPYSQWSQLPRRGLSTP
jgi:ankyrin repeat protein